MGSTGTFVGINSTTTASTLYFIGVGTNTYHSLKTNYTNVLTGSLSKATVTVSTSSTHGLRVDDTVDLSVQPGITTTIKVAYNDYNRRLVIDPRTFASGDVSIGNNTITISRHGFYSGQKIIHTATTSSGGLADNEIYYVSGISYWSIWLSFLMDDST